MGVRMLVLAIISRVIIQIGIMTINVFIVLVSIRITPISINRGLLCMSSTITSFITMMIKVLSRVTIMVASVI